MGYIKFIYMPITSHLKVLVRFIFKENDCLAYFCARFKNLISYPLEKSYPELMNLG